MATAKGLRVRVLVVSPPYLPAMSLRRDLNPRPFGSVLWRRQCLRNAPPRVAQRSPRWSTVRAQGMHSLGSPVHALQTRSVRGAYVAACCSVPSPEACLLALNKGEQLVYGAVSDAFP